MNEEAKCLRYRRPDITHALIHLTGDRSAKRGLTAEQALHSILQEGIIRGSGNDGYIKGPNRAACFTEMPLASVRYFIDSHHGKHKYKYFGIAISKSSAWDIGARPVIYLPDHEAAWIPEEEKWRHVQFNHGEIDFTHEREWRSKGDFDMNRCSVYVIVPDREHESQIRLIDSQFIKNNIIGYLHMNLINDIL
jgi:hypothetical protein